MIATVTLLLAEGPGVGTMILIALGILALFVFLGLFGPLFGLWIQALSARANVGIAALIGMRLRKVNPRVIVLSRIQAVRAGIDVTTEELESHYLAGGRPVNVVNALIAANRANIKLTFQLATAIDLAGRDIL